LVLIGSAKRLADGRESIYAAVLLDHLRHWLNEDGDVSALVDRLPQIRRENICGN
jgi:ArsR family transcriptional regulator, arsenate/arsenite/antimonite-responsive transcriptional repressor